MEHRQILGSPEIATNFSKLSCPAALQESPGMFYISVFHSDRFLQELLLVIEDMECRGLDIIYYIKFSRILDELHHHHHHRECYGIIAHCNGRQIFPGRAQLIAKQQEDGEDASIIRASSTIEKPSVHELG